VPGHPAPPSDAAVGPDVTDDGESVGGVPAGEFSVANGRMACISSPVFTTRRKI
jgi:hypothetical protein